MEGGGERRVQRRPRVELDSRIFSAAMGGAAAGAAPLPEREQVDYGDL